MNERKIRFFLGLVLAMSLFLMSSSLLLAQLSSTEKDAGTSRNSNMSFANFNISGVDFNDGIAKENIEYLAEYYICRAAQNDSSRECSATGSSSLSNECNYYFNEYHLSYGRILKSGRITPSFLNSCYANGGEFDDEKICNEFGRALLSGDSNFCIRFSNSAIQKGCLSMMNRNYRGNWQRSLYINAVRSKDINKCEIINEPKARAACRGVLSSDPKICENNEGFKFFKQRYIEGK